MGLLNKAAEIFGNFLTSPLLYPFQGNTINVSHQNITGKFRIRPWTADKWIVWEIWGFNEYNRNYLTIHPSDRVVDIGAHIGIFTVFASKAAFKGEVLAYEPHPGNYHLLQQNLSINGSYNVKPFNVAVGKNNSRQYTSLYINSENSGGHSTIHTVGSIKISVPQISLSQIMSNHKIRRINYLKIDTEGSESDILLTAPTKVIKAIDQISLEYHDYLSPVKHTEIIKFLTFNGFSTQLIKYPVLSQIMGLGNIIASRKR